MSQSPTNQPKLRVQNSSQYSGISWQCHSLESLCLSFDFQIFQPLCQDSGDRSECTNYNWFMFHTTFSFLQRFTYLSLFSLSLVFYFVFRWDGKSIIIIIIYSLEFFTSGLADGLSPEFHWQQISLSFQDSSQYSGRSH